MNNFIRRTTTALFAVLTLTAGAQAKENVGRAYDDITFTEGAPGVHFGLLLGDWAAGPLSLPIVVGIPRT